MNYCVSLRNSNISFGLFVVTTVIFVNGSLDSSATAQSTEDQVRNAWQEVAARLANRSISVEYAEASRQSNEVEFRPNRISQLTVNKSREGCFLQLNSFSEGAEGLEAHVVARNAQYLFELKRQMGHSEWFLADIDPSSKLNKSPDSRLVKLCTALELDASLIPWSMVLQEGLVWRIVEGSLPISAASTDKVDVQTSIDLFAQMDDEIWSDGQSRKVRRTITFSVDPSNHFLPMRVRDDFGGVMQREFTLSNWTNANGVSIPFQCSLRILPKDMKRATYTMTNVSGSAPSTSEFRLPAFGIKEPGFIKREIPWLSIITAALVCGFLGFWIWGVITRPWTSCSPTPG
jgi:hypothetical protein